MTEPRIYRQPLADFGDDPENANRGTARGRDALDKSITELGAARSLVADKNGLIPAGNKTRQALQRAGVKDALVIETDGSVPVIVKRTDWDLTEKGGAARRYALADNRVAELDLDFDPEVLAKHLADGIDLSGLWSESELRGIIGKGALTGDGDDDPVPEPPKDPVSKPGDLWLLGPHRLLVGSSVAEDDVRRARGELVPWIMVTDPPYGVDYDPKWREGLDGKKRKRTGLVKNDHQADWTPAYQMFTGDVGYVWHGALQSPVVNANLVATGFQVRTEIVWSKTRFVISRGHYHSRHESCWYAVRAGKSARWAGDHKQTTVWEMAAPGTREGGDEDGTIHGTQKPLEAMLRPIVNHGKRGDVVYEPFCGSGTTLIAAERAGRRCVALEIDPAYADVVVDRWQRATGGGAVLGPESPSLAGRAAVPPKRKRRKP